MADSSTELDTPETKPKSRDASRADLIEDAVAEKQSFRSKDIVKANLERMSSASIQAFNERDFAYENTQDRRDFISSIAPKFEAHIESFTQEAMSWDQLQSLWPAFAAQEPDVQLHIFQMSTDVYSNGTAIVYLELTATGYESLNFIRFMEMKWKVMNGKWMYYSCTTMRGSMGNTGLI